MKLIKLTQDRFSVVDDEDFGELSKHKWCVNGWGYVIRMRNKKNYLHAS